MQASVQASARPRSACTLRHSAAAAKGATPERRSPVSISTTTPIVVPAASAAALSKYSRKGLTDIEDIEPLVRFLVTEGWWITGQTIFANGGYTTR